LDPYLIDDKEFVKVAFRLEVDEDGYPPVSTETLWAQREGDGFRLDNTPFFVHGVALGDIVHATPVEGMLGYQHVLKRSGHGTVRVIMFEGGDVEKTREEFRKLGCPSELSSISTLFAVDIPPMDDYSAVRNFLEQGLEKGRFDYEEGWVLW
jgi:hypothetical protein